MAIVICTGCDRYIDLDTDSEVEYIDDEFYHWQCAADAGYINWEDDNPVRTSKSAKPKMGVSGRSLKSVITRIIGKKGKEK